MIGWNVDVGYFNGRDTQLTNISQVVFTDFNRPYTFGFLVNAPTISFNSNKDGYISAAQYFESYIGSQEYSYVYGVPTTHISKDGYDNLNCLAPAMTKAYPNLIQHYRDTSLSYPIFVSIAYFKSLKKLLCLYRIAYDRSDIVYSYNVGDDGALSNRSTHSYSTLNFFQIYSRDNTPAFYYYGFSNYQKGKPLSECSLMRIAFVQATKDAYGEISQPPNISLFNSFLDSFFGSVEPDITVITPVNPYKPGGPSGPTDPDLPPGTFDDASDPIPDSPLPTISAADTGFTRIYNPTLSQVKALAQYLWTTPDVIATIWNHIKQFFENPMDAIIGFNLVPVHVPDGGTTNFKLMYIDTGVAMTAAANQFVDVDCGTLEVKRYYGSALDQSPYTKVSCFLPYIGTVQLNTDEVMGATLQVKYRVDICSGSCVAKIFIDGNCIYQYSGHCAINIPISSADFSSYVSAAINVAKLAIGAATAGAGGAAMAAGQVAGTEQQTGNMGALQTQGGSLPNLSAVYQGQSQQQPPSQSTTSASFAGISPANISNTVGEIMNAKPHVEHSGSFSGNTGYLGVRRPFIIIERPNMCMPENYQALNGFPAMITMELSTCNGFTRVQQVQLTGMTATNPEQAEILELLKSGVIL